MYVFRQPIETEARDLIRRLLAIMVALLLWTVQTADAAIDHSPTFGGPEAETAMLVADQGVAGAGKTDDGLGCNAGCVCHVFHHAYLDGLWSSADQPLASGQDYVFADCDVAGILSKPPTRPPLV